MSSLRFPLDKWGKDTYFSHQGNKAMDLNHFKEQVVLLEERIMSLSLTGYNHIEAGEVDELWNTTKLLSPFGEQLTGAEERKLNERLGAVMAELAGLKMRLEVRGARKTPTAA
jgi:hypothetical protein